MPKLARHKKETMLNFQIRKPLSLDRDWKELLTHYDEGLSENRAVIKLMTWAIEQWYLPGYERRQRPKHSSMEEREQEKYGEASGATLQSGDYKEEPSRPLTNK